MKIIRVILLSLLVATCTTSTHITGSWKNTTLVPKTYSQLFVTGLTSNAVVRALVENDLSAALAKSGAQGIKSIDVFPPSFGKDSLTRSKFLDVVHEKKCDGVLTVSLLKKETESRYEPGGYAYAPASHYGYYGNFYGYYNHYYPSTYNTGYYTTEEVYYLETNLFDAASENLMWSAQSQTYKYDDFNALSKEFAHIIVTKMGNDGMLPVRTK